MKKSTYYQQCFYDSCEVKLSLFLHYLSKIIGQAEEATN